ncbi:MAG: molybdopterin cofactor-binding domain-containing protein [Hyphomicrobium sp.]
MNLPSHATDEPGSAARRGFLKVAVSSAVGGGLLLGFAVPARSEIRDTLTKDAPFAPNAFLRIDRTGKVTFVMPVVEMGQGTYTSLPMLIAEELEVDVDKVAIEHSPPDDKIYNNPLIGVQMTGGSTAVRGTYVPLRRAGATARVMLVTAAAQRWKVDPASCLAHDGVVRHVASGRVLGYGRLVDAAAKLAVPENVVLKEPHEFKLIGTPHRRLDTSGKVNGAAVYGIDTRLPALKFAVLAQSPTFGGKLVSVDTAKAMSVRGVTQVVRLDDALAVVAVHTWAAKQGLAAAEPKWDAGPNAKLSTTDIVAQLVAASERTGAVAVQVGDAPGAIARATRKVEAAYEQPFLAHATMEPMNCTVHMTRETCDVWLGTQVPGLTQAAVMKETGLPRDKVRLHNHLLGGGFGRRLEFDGTVRAVQIARHVEGPVQVIWTREEDIQHDMYRPYYYDRLSAAVDETGKAVAWSHRITGSSIIARYSPSWIKDGVDPDAVDGSVDQPYGIEQVRVAWIAQEPPAGISTAFWRGVGVTRGTFAVETFIDELAIHAKRDPLAYRVSLLDKNPRAKAVLQRAAERSGWGQPLAAGTGRGIALCIGFGSFIAQVVQVSVDKDGSVTPTHVWCVVDCGIVVNPDTVRAQMESGIVFGLSGALYGEITLKDGRVEQTNFADYRVMRINETPLIDVTILKSSEAPGGIGEPGTSCVMPAFTNAIFAATGKRIRKLPVGAQLRSA